MRKFVAGLVLVGALLMPVQPVLAEMHENLPPWWEQAIQTQMMLNKMMMKQMKAGKKKMMTPAQEQKLMKMLKEIEDLLTEAGGG